MFDRNKGIKNLMEENKKSIEEVEFDNVQNEKEENCEDVELLNYEDLKDGYVGENFPLYEYIKELEIKNFDSEKFLKGVHSVSELCGKITALCNVGINPHKALDYLMEVQLSDDVLKNNSDVAKMNADANVEISRMESANAQKNII